MHSGKTIIIIKNLCQSYTDTPGFGYLKIQEHVGTVLDLEKISTAL